MATPDSHTAPAGPIDAGSHAAASSSSSTPPRAPDARRFEIVAKQPTRSRAASNATFKLTDLGGRMIVSTERPVASAEGSGPLTEVARLGAGLPQGPMALAGLGGRSDFAVAAFGVHAEARAVPFEFHLYRLGGDGWTKIPGALLPSEYPRAVERFDREVIVVAIDYIEPMIAGYESPTPKWSVFTVSDDGKRRNLAVERGFVVVATAADPAGHLFALGSRAGRTGLWLAHWTHHQAPTLGLVPGTSRCTADDVWGIGARIFALSGGQYVVPPLYQHGCVTSVEDAGVASDEELVTVTPSGARWTHDKAGFRRRFRDVATVLPDLADGPCSAHQIVEQDSGDVWLTAECRNGGIVARLGRPQAPVVLP